MGLIHACARDWVIPEGISELQAAQAVESLTLFYTCDQVEVELRRAGFLPVSPKVSLMVRVLRFCLKNRHE